jgi:hypothetical protein
MTLKIYINSSLFDNSKSDTFLFQNNKDSLIKLDNERNGLVIDSLDEDTLLAIIYHQIGTDKITNYDELSFVLEGGVYLEHQDKTIISQCCGDISNVENWRVLLNANNTSFEELWIGHPTVLYKFDKDKIIISDYTEPGPEITNKFIFDKDEFISLLSEKIERFDDFKIRIFEVIDKSNLDEQEKVKVKLFNNI